MYKPLDFLGWADDTEGMKNQNNHSTRTYRGKPACAGSQMESNQDGTCSVCGRGNISHSWGEGINTHLHPQDMATKPAARLVPVAAPKPAWRPNPAQALAIQAFYQDSNPATYAAMQATGATDGHYTTWARTQGLVTV